MFSPSLGDDCITIGSGTTNVHASNGYCEGGHGLSIGSLGSGGSVAQVNGIYFENFVMVHLIFRVPYAIFLILAPERFVVRRALQELDGRKRPRQRVSTNVSTRSCGQHPTRLCSITWKNIAFSKVMIPIYITQKYVVYISYGSRL